MKKLLSVMLLIVMLFSVAVTSASACSQQTVDAIKLATLNGMVRTANATVKGLVRVAQATPYNDIAWLQASVKATNAPVYAYARLIGAQIGCKIDVYVIDGQTVDVDPLYVINVD